MANRRIRPHVNPFSITKEISFAGFDNDNPIIVDVGAANGEFSFDLLQKFGNTKNFILFEIRPKIYQRLLEKFKEYENVRIFDGNAGQNFESILKPSIERGVLIEEIFINFPDPHFKAKHKKRRFINLLFLEKCAQYFSSETRWIFQTDQKFLFDETLEILKDSEFSKLKFFQTSPHKIQTEWEKVKIAEKSEIYRVEFGK
jgi:tRNA (guanine-N7-)-methyltransferase